MLDDIETQDVNSIDDLADLEAADLEAVDHQDADLEAADHQSSDLESVDHQAADLEVVDHQAADLEVVDHPVADNKAADNQVLDLQESDHMADDEDDLSESDSNLFQSVWDSVTDFVSPFISSDSSEESDFPLQEGYELIDIETFALSPVVSSSGLKGVLLDVIGPYDNIITQYRYQANSSSSYSYVHETTPDYPWIFSAILFICLILSLFSLVKRFFTWMK